MRPELSTFPSLASAEKSNRRDFIQRIAVASAAAGTTLAGFGAAEEPGAAHEPKPQPANQAPPFVGIQMGPHTMLDEGVERSLDLIQETAAVNSVMPYSHGYNNVFFKPLRNRADHGVPLTDNAGRKFPLVWVKTHDNFYKNTTLRHQRVDATFEHANRDLFAELVEPCRRRSLKIYARVLEDGSRTITNFENVVTRDINGRPTNTACWNHPDTSAFGRTRWRICFAVTTSTASNGAPSGRVRS
jgi:hypothetical protein